MDPPQHGPHRLARPTPADSGIDSSLGSGIDSSLGSGIDSGIDSGLSSGLGSATGVAATPHRRV
jgi:hypothetical protein